MIFLLQYDSKTGTLTSIDEYSDAESEAAQEASLAAELRSIHMRTGLEVILLEAPSIDALRQTHSRYFQTLSDLSKLRRGERHP
jgi:hypothetical protein